MVVSKELIHKSRWAPMPWQQLCKYEQSYNEALCRWRLKKCLRISPISWPHHTHHSISHTLPLPQPLSTFSEVMRICNHVYMCHITTWTICQRFSTVQLNDFYAIHSTLRYVPGIEISPNANYRETSSPPFWYRHCIGCSSQANVYFITDLHTPYV